MGILTTGPAVKNHISPKRARKLIANISNYVPFAVPCLSTSSSTSSPPASSTSSSQDWHGKSKNRKKWEYDCRVTVTPRLMDQQKLKTQIKMKKTKNYEVNYCKICGNGYRISRRIWWIRVFNYTILSQLFS